MRFWKKFNFAENTRQRKKTPKTTEEVEQEDAASAAKILKFLIKQIIQNEMQAPIYQVRGLNAEGI